MLVQYRSLNFSHSLGPQVIVMQRYSSPLSTVIKLMEAAAPVFRKACPEAPEEMINLPSLLLSPALNLRHFAVTDVMIAFTLARSTFFKYDVSYTPEVFSQLLQGASGLQWLHGVPDQYIILLAWITGLYEDTHGNTDPEIIAQIEREVESVQISPRSSPDPIHAVWRLTVQECWRQVVYVYLYVVSFTVFFKPNSAY